MEALPGKSKGQFEARREFRVSKDLHSNLPELPSRFKLLRTASTGKIPLSSRLRRVLKRSSRALKW